MEIWYFLFSFQLSCHGYSLKSRTIQANSQLIIFGSGKPVENWYHCHFFFWFSVSMSTSDKHTSLDKSAEIEVFTTWKRICMNFLWLASFFLHYRCVFPPFTVSSKHPLLFLTKLNIWYEKSVIFKRKIIILSMAGLFMIFVFCLVCMLITSNLYFILCVQSEYVIWNHIYFFNLYAKNILFFSGEIPHFIFMFHTKFRLWEFG